MHKDTKESVGQTTSRRALLATSALGAATLSAGCIGGTDDSDDEPASGSAEGGDRVPELQFEYWTGFGDTTSIFEEVGPIIAENIREHLGVPVNFYPKEGITSQNEIVNDERNANLILSGAPASPQQLDPDGLYGNHAINAGAVGTGAYNFAHYANCEFSELIEQQRNAPNEEERMELVQEAASIASNDVLWINLMPRVYYGAYRSDLEIEGGEGGIVRTNPYPILNAETGGEKIAINCPQHSLLTTNHLANRDQGYLHLMNNFVYTPLLKYNRDLELVPALAEDYEVEENRVFEFTLREATFHNGDPITAEDVKFTFELLEENFAQIPHADSYPYESIDVEDDRTVVFNLSDPYPPWLNVHAPFWGILPKNVWEEADDPLEFEPDPLVGSGPVQVTSFQQNQALQMEPYEDHWNAPSVEVEFLGYQDAQGEATALQNGNITVQSDIPANIAYDQLMDTDGVTVETWTSYEGYFVTPMMHFGPTKFREFRMAMSQVLDREQIVEVGTRGDAEPNVHSFRWPENHPLVQQFDDGTLTRIAESTSPNPDVARNVLEEEGWTWDDEGRLHYPDDADLEPLWPQGSGPAEMPDEFPCVEGVE